MIFVKILTLTAITIFISQHCQVGDSTITPGRLGGFVSWDSGIYPSITPPYVQWLDDDTVVYKGNMAPKPATSAEARSLVDAIIVWHLGDAPFGFSDERWLKMGANRSVCAADGVIVYPVGNAPTGGNGKQGLKIEEGIPGHFKERVIYNEDKELEKDPGFFIADDNRRCDFFRDQHMIGHTWTVDYDREFYLDFGLRGQKNIDDPIILISAIPNKSPVSLPITLKQVTPYCTQYRRFSHLFYLQSCPNMSGISSNHETCKTYWTLDPNTGVIIQKCLLVDSIINPIVQQLLPTMNGIYFASTENMTLTDVGFSGLFRSGVGSNSLVIKGFVQNVTISPNGCRLAFSYAKALQDIVVGSAGRYSLVAIDVCQPRK